jgi:hypothetical protein
MNLTSLFATEPAERKARLRSMRMATRVLCGERARQLELALQRAERDEAALPEVVQGIEALMPLDRRRILSSWWTSREPTAGVHDAYDGTSG